MSSCIGMLTWDACESCNNYDEENGCALMLVGNPTIEIDFEEVVCLDFEEIENGV